MAIREDIVSSAVSFLQDPNVVSSPLENKLSFLRSKNLTQEEIDAAFARAGGPPPASTTPQPASASAPAPVQQQPYYPQHQQPPYGWQSPPPEPPKRDWRDWFIMATVVGGVGYGLYFLSKRYIYPLVAPPTPEKLDQDKAMVDEQFEKAFATLEQLTKDTAALKECEAARTEKLDKVLEDLEGFVRESKSAGRRQEDETERLRDDIKNLQASIPKSMAAQKEFTDDRLRDISNEVGSLKALISQRMSTAQTSALISQRMSTAQTSAPPPATALTATHNAGARAKAASVSPASTPSADVKDNVYTNGSSGSEDGDKAGPSTSAPSKQDYVSLGGRSSPFGSGAAKASIPAWQMAAATNSNKTYESPAKPTTGNASVAGSQPQ
ncbi:peroxisomal membrane anchor protein conserved region-domain-containing protein [Xylaria palmicola]|nr:peroxisomal membrane anchor protein conserved region-domain-containing protein [Xylaria palmicola]